MGIGHDVTYPFSFPLLGYIHDLWLFSNVESDIASLMFPCNNNNYIYSIIKI